MTKPQVPRDAEQPPGDPLPTPATRHEPGGLLASPEYLIRRTHQIASAAFSEACAGLNITPPQYAALFALRQHARAGQNELGRLIALDRSTTARVVRSLRERDLVSAEADAADRRKSLLDITNKGRLLLAQAEQRSAKASQALMAIFTEKQASGFLAMLRALDEAAAQRPDEG